MLSLHILKMENVILILIKGHVFMDNNGGVKSTYSERFGCIASIPEKNRIATDIGDGY